MAGNFPEGPAGKPSPPGRNLEGEAARCHLVAATPHPHPGHGRRACECRPPALPVCASSCLRGQLVCPSQASCGSASIAPSQFPVPTLTPRSDV